MITVMRIMMMIMMTVMMMTIYRDDDASTKNRRALHKIIIRRFCQVKLQHTNVKSIELQVLWEI